MKTMFEDVEDTSSEQSYAVVPIQSELWNSAEKLYADCLTDLHSKSRSLIQRTGLEEIRPYSGNTLRFRVAREQDLSNRLADYSDEIVYVYVPLRYFKSIKLSVELSNGLVEIPNLTAKKLVDIALLIYEEYCKQR